MTLPEAKLRRDRALACMILAASTALAVFLSVFGGRDSLALAGAREEVARHEGLLRDTSAVLQQNHLALVSTRASLKAIEPAARP
jgi:hypothetical protein